MFNQDFLNLMDRIAHFITGYFHKILSKVGHGYSIVLVGVAGVFLVSSNVIQPSPACNTLYHIVFTPRHATPSLQEYIPRHPFSLMASLSCIKSIDDFCRSQLPLPAVSLAHTYSYTVVCCSAHGQPLAHIHSSVRQLDIDVLLRIKSPIPNCFQTKSNMLVVFQTGPRMVRYNYLIVVYIFTPPIDTHQRSQIIQRDMPAWIIIQG